MATTTPGPCQDHGRWDAFNEIFAEFAPRADARPHPDHLDVRSWLRAAGFVDVRSANIVVHLPVCDPQTCWDFHMSHGFAARVEALTPSDAAEIQRRALAELTNCTSPAASSSTVAQ